MVLTNMPADTEWFTFYKIYTLKTVKLRRNMIGAF
jgi:hypothetical protein